MTDYRRNFVAGGSFFFTVNLAERRLHLLTQHLEALPILRTCLETYDDTGAANASYQAISFLRIQRRGT